MLILLNIYSYYIHKFILNSSRLYSREYYSNFWFVSIVSFSLLCQLHLHMLRHFFVQNVHTYINMLCGYIHTFNSHIMSKILFPVLLLQQTIHDTSTKITLTTGIWSIIIINIIINERRMLHLCCACHCANFFCYSDKSVI